MAGAFQCLLLITSPLLCTTLLSSRPIGSSASLTRSKNSSLSAMLSTPDVDLWLRSMVDLWSCNSSSRKHYVPLVQQELQRTQPTRPITFQTASRGACHQRAVVIARSSPMTDKEAVERVQDAAGESMWSGSGINTLSSAYRKRHGGSGAVLPTKCFQTPADVEAEAEALRRAKGKAPITEEQEGVEESDDDDAEAVRVTAVAEDLACCTTSPSCIQTSHFPVLAASAAGLRRGGGRQRR